jgi:3',5'-cyclic-AMP phosphodiesterase
VMNRRRFLIGAAQVLAAMAAGCARIWPGKGGGAQPGTGSASAQPASGASQPVAPTAERPFRAALLSDVHLQDEPTVVSEKLAKAAADLQAAGADLWVVNGDLADHGMAAEHAEFKRVIGPFAARDRLLVTTGNHEFYDMKTTDDVSIKRFTDAYGQPKPYSNAVHAGVHFVMIADEQWKTAPTNKDWCWVTPEQFAWFKQVLAEHKDKFTCVFMHQPLNDTVAGSVGEKAFGSSNMGAELHAVLAENPQVKLWFSGHTHRRLEAEQQVVRKGNTTFVALGSTIYQLKTTGSGGRGRDNDASQSRLLEIYPDKVVVRGRDHTEARWMDELALTIPRA